MAKHEIFLFEVFTLMIEDQYDQIIFETIQISILMMQKSVSSYTHSRNTSNYSLYNPSSATSPSQFFDLGKTQSINNSSFRGSSPNSKTKIKLVSPLKDKGSLHHQPKENHPPVTTYPAKVGKNSINIELGGKSAQTNNPSYVKPIPTRQTVSTFPMPPQVVFKKNSHFYVAQPVRHQSPSRVQSPPKICINNKCFELGNIKSQIVYVTPLHHRKVSSQIPKLSSKAQSYSKSVQGFYHTAWPSQLVIQEENAMEELKESYESELREIKQLHQEIQENNIQIKELLKSSRVSRQLISSRISNQQLLNPSQENFAAEIISEIPVSQCKEFLIYQQPIKVNSNQNSVIHHQSDEVSVQTDNFDQSQDHSMSKNESRHSKFSITKNNQCQIQVICTSTLPKEKEAKSKNLIESSLKSPQNQCTLSPYEVNINLKEIRAKCHITDIKYSEQEIEYQESQKIITPRFDPQMVKSADYIAPIIKGKQQQYESQNFKQSNVAKSHHDKKQESKEQKSINSPVKDQMLSSIISSGKRRINNSIYL